MSVETDRRDNRKTPSVSESQPRSETGVMTRALLQVWSLPASTIAMGVQLGSNLGECFQPLGRFENINPASEAAQHDVLLPW